MRSKPKKVTLKKYILGGRGFLLNMVRSKDLKKCLKKLKIMGNIWWQIRQDLPGAHHRRQIFHFLPTGRVCYFRHFRPKFMSFCEIFAVENVSLRDNVFTRFRYFKLHYSAVRNFRRWRLRDYGTSRLRGLKFRNYKI